MQKKRRSSDGNLVNVGNFDADGANVNNWNPDNSDDDLGVSFSRSLCLGLNGRGFFLLVFGFFNPTAEH
ncbi:MAG: hypothetical protein Q7S86_03080, partial [bacterium]|nr:hypothetical protein [bacterium]